MPYDLVIVGDSGSLVGFGLQMFSSSNLGSLPSFLNLVQYFVIEFELLD
jgi:hypothetical protein